MATKTKDPAKQNPEQQEFGIQSTFDSQKVPSQTAMTKNSTTKVTIKFDCGFGNQLFIRGEGCSELHWDKGTKLKNVNRDEWVWETNQPFNQCKFKVLINDIHYEAGDNHQIASGATFRYTPRF